jgi:penicillin-binding protein 2
MTTPIQHEDRRNFSVRLTVMKGAVILVFSALAVAFWWFQVARHEEFAARADANHIRTITLRAPRGPLLDRDGQMMVSNQQIHQISIMREQTDDLETTLTRLADITGADLAAMRDVLAKREKEPIYRPIPVIENASPAQVARVKARLIELPAVIVQSVPTRRYPTDGLGAHLFGYVGEVAEEQLARPEFATLEPGDIVGKQGIELALNALLMGMDGAQYVIVDSKGREIDAQEPQEPVDGQPIKLTIDLDMQKALEEAFRHYKYWGAAAFIDPNNGDVLAMTSLPAYDPNDFAVGIDQATWAGLNKDPLKPLNNRLIQGTYPPGSTFKILMAVVGLQEKLITPSTRVHCSGGFFFTRYFQCHKEGGHGSLNLRQAIQQSCNVYFYTIGAKLGDKIDVIHKWAEKLGLVGRTGIDLPNEVASFVASSEWAKKTRKDGKWYPGETISVSIGQGAIHVTPMGLAMFAATVANGGTLFKPNLVKEVFDGKEWKPVSRPDPKSVTKMDPEHVKAIHEGMWMVVNAGGGTGGRARIEGYNVAGKTGTAQANISLENLARLRGEAARRFRDHGWWIFYAPADKPEVAGVVFTENSEHGYLGAPIMKHVLETYFAKKEKRPLPTLAPLPGAPAVPVVAGTPARPQPRAGGTAPSGAGTTPSGRAPRGTGGR